MNEIVTTEEIKSKIYIIRGKEVMLDSDLAKLYHVETKRVNGAVRRNPEKFPERYSFELSADVIDILWSQISTANISVKNKYMLRVFAEQGIAMLARYNINNYDIIDTLIIRIVI